MELTEIKFAIDDALDAMNHAVCLAEDHRERCDRQWKELNDMHAMMKSLMIQWGKVIPDSVKEAMHGEQVENDRLADLADAQSY